MKRFWLVLGIIGVMLAGAGASIWEGAAGVSSNGELPDRGYYAATKSFPRNTVVDVVNLETGKSIRVIVSAGLESPGLLAMLSQEAADAIGIANRSIGRVRMSMPADPIAFSQFPEGIHSRSDPDFDPQAAINSVRTRPVSAAPEEGIPEAASSGAYPAEAPQKPPAESPRSPEYSVSYEEAYGSGAPPQEDMIISDLPEVSWDFTRKSDPPLVSRADPAPSAALSPSPEETPEITEFPQPVPTGTERPAPMQSAAGAPETLRGEPQAAAPDVWEPLTPPGVSPWVAADKPSQKPAARPAPPKTEPAQPPVKGPSEPEIARPGTKEAEPEVTQPLTQPEAEGIRPLAKPAEPALPLAKAKEAEPEVAQPLAQPEAESIQPLAKPAEPADLPAAKRPGLPAQDPAKQPAAPFLAKPPEPPVQPVPPGEFSIYLDPADKRPPQNTRNWNLPPESEIPPIPKRPSPSPNRISPLTEHTPAPAKPPQSAGLAVAPSAGAAQPRAPASRPLPPDLFTELPPELLQERPPARQNAAPSARNPDPPAAQPKAPASRPLPPDLFTELPPELLQERPPARQNAALEPPADRRFSVPLITSLESGKKYIQIVAYNKPEDVENQLTQIGQSYPLVVQPGGKNPEKPLYRILIGPLNSGETGPLLQQFKQSGYHDAYIR